MENILYTKAEMTAKKEPRPKCGIVMPISAIDGLPKEHWADVLNILKRVADNAGFEPNLVSDADEVSVIQKTIVQNLYNNDIIICDVSGKNPNVMFEMGMRLAFDKPTIIIKDYATDFSFDTSVIEHIPYPRDLRLPLMEIFQEKLKNKLQKTLERATKDPSYSTFLKNFGEFKVAQLSEKTVTSEEFILSSLKDISAEIKLLRNDKRDIYLDDDIEIEAFIRNTTFKIKSYILKIVYDKKMSLKDISKDDIDSIINENVNKLSVTESLRRKIKTSLYNEIVMAKATNP